MAAQPFEHDRLAALGIEQDMQPEDTRKVLSENAVRVFGFEV